jgi:hypothetical protein
MSSDLVTQVFQDRTSSMSFDLDDWIHETSRSYGNLTQGHDPGAQVPDWARQEGPLRATFVDEFSFRARVEEAAVRGLAQVVAAAPDLKTMDFYASQMADEARHAYVFRQLLVGIGYDAKSIEAQVASLSRRRVASILEPIEEFAQPYAAARDFAAGVTMVAVIAEGALAPAAELSSRKWRGLHPAAAQVAHGANLDEVRHLNFGTAILREHLDRTRGERERIAELIRSGMALWGKLPIVDMLAERERLFQDGMAPLKSRIETLELVPGRLLIDTTADERLALQFQWSLEMRERQLRVLGIEL